MNNLGLSEASLPDLDTLYTIDSKGNARQWSIAAIEDENGVRVKTEYGQVGGKIQTVYKIIKRAASQPTLYQQAHFEASAAWQKQYDLGARPTIEEARGVKMILPMLAKTYTPGKTKIDFPVYVQPKLNGVRCLAKQDGDTINFISRGGKSYNAALKHLIEPVKNLGPSDTIKDGEIYIHGLSLQEISGIVRTQDGDKALSDRLQYWIYDIADEDMTYVSRKTMIASLNFDGKKTIMVPTLLAKNHGQIKIAHDFWVKNGFEGLIIRTPNGKYRMDYRSPELMKYKEFIDHEFEIIGGKEAEGTHQGCVIFSVRGEAIDKDGKASGEIVEFDATPKASLEQRRKWMKDLPSLTGKKLTVRYFELSIDKVPIFPIGIVIRDYE